MRTIAPLFALLLTLPTVAGAQQPARRDSASPANAAPVARFDWYTYTGHDSVYDVHPAGKGEYANPILSGFYPDPALARVGNDYYLIGSTFAYFPGIPIFRSKDLVNWTQIGNVIHRPEQLKFDSLGMSRGVFAPTINFHDGTFYVLNTCVDCGGNYLVTASNPAGPWSNPTWLPEVGGIDPSIFFDDDGKTYVINNDEPTGGSTYQGHRAIWIREFDVATKKVKGPATQIINAGVDITQKPIWIEGPHIYKINGKYYLSCAEGGTAVDHRQVVFRSDNVLGPYVPAPAPINPILTQRLLDPSRPFPVTSSGHADFLQTQNGEWWGIFLATRPYEDDYYNTGRETFLLPLEWKDGWPSFIRGREPIPYAVKKPNLPAQPAPAIPTHGNFTVREEFNGSSLAPYWMMLRTPREQWWTLGGGALTMRARPDDIAGKGQPSFVGRRQQHQKATFTTAMHFTPAKAGDRAGLVAFQSENFFYALTSTLVDGKPVIQVERRNGANDTPTVIATKPLAARAGAPLYLKIDANGGRYDFSFATQRDKWTPVLENADGKMLSTKGAGGAGANFTGVVVGMYAHAAP
jgi:alpha-N-arabinofuranosidase